jgi:hypothetical protein
MEIARLTAICRKSDCGPLENELVRLRAQIGTLEEGKADLEEGRDNFESQYAPMVKQLACKEAELEAAENERADLEATPEKENADLEKEKGDLEATLEKEKADLEAEILELKLEHEQHYKETMTYTTRGWTQRAKNEFGCPLRIPELARARPSLRCAPFKYSWCMGRIRCVTIAYMIFGAEEMDFGSQRSPTSKYDFELEKRVLYAP